MNTTNIYALLDPESREIRYIGKTNTPSKRFSWHLGDAKNNYTHKQKWIQSLLKVDKVPEMAVLEVCPVEVWQERERFWIALLAPHGRLVNATLGGEGFDGYQFTDETRERMRAAKVGKARPAEVREKMSASHTGKKRTEEHRAAISRGNIGRHAKTYLLEFPDGQQGHITNLTKFCSENSVNVSCLRKTLKTENKFKGYRLLSVV